MHTHDVAIIGSGLVGSAAALALSRAGLEVLVLEASRHPRFAIGESLVPTTTLGLARLAQRYGVPELRQISHYPALAQAGLTGWPKLGFWFGHHREGAHLRPGHELIFPSPGLPLGPDVHLLRSKSDAFLASRFPRYGVDYLDETSVLGVAFERGIASLSMTRAGSPTRARARFVLNCSGAPIAGISRGPARRDLRTNSRAIFGHFVGVPSLDDVLGGPPGGSPIWRRACTQHHCFDGGWIWVIPFDDGTASVGLMLDRAAHPEPALSPSLELWRHVSRFPSVANHLRDARPTRPLVGTGRVQRRAETISGPGYLTAPHAAGFVDPLYSTGLDLSVAFLCRALPLIVRAARGERVDFSGLERVHAAESNAVDTLVAGSYLSFRHPDLFKQQWRLWVYASLLQYTTHFAFQDTEGYDPGGRYGALWPAHARRLAAVYQALDEGRDQPPASLARTLRASFGDLDEPFGLPEIGWEIDATAPCCPLTARPPSQWLDDSIQRPPGSGERYEPAIMIETLERLERGASRDVAQARRDATRGGYRRGLDLVRALQVAPDASAAPLIESPPALRPYAQDFGRLVHHPPRALYAPRRAPDLVALVRRARRERLRLAARSAGHSQNGMSLARGGVAVDLRGMDRVFGIDPQAGTITVGAGLLWRDVIARTAEVGLQPVVLTDNLAITVGGTLSVGGIGASSFRWGGQVHNCASLEIVLGTGEVLEASPEHHSEIFTHALGGLGQFGFITRATLRLRPLRGGVDSREERFEDIGAFFDALASASSRPDADYIEAAVDPSHGFWLRASSERASGEDPLAFARRFQPVFTRAPAYIDPSIAHPWTEMFLPWPAARRYTAAARARFPDARILIWPVRGSPARGGLILPEGPSSVLVSVLEDRPGDEVSGALPALRDLAELGASLGGTRYLSGWLGFDRRAWRAHFGERWGASQAMRRRCDPDNVFKGFGPGG